MQKYFKIDRLKGEENASVLTTPEKNTVLKLVNYLF